MLRARTIYLLLITGCLLLTGCSVQTILSNKPAVGATPSDPTTKGTPTNTGWEQVDTAIELRRMQLHSGGVSGEFVILRLDPHTYRVRVAYDTNHPGHISEWAKAIKPIALINGGYFDASKRATALVIFDGIVRGETYRGFGGMVVVNAQGDFELRSLRQQPYDPNEPLQQAMQSAPMLIQPGGTVSDLDTDNDRSRRTVIARDRNGRILLIICDWPLFTLKELANGLKDSDLELDAALNLDGGRSTGMYLQTDKAKLTMDSFDSVPLVLVVDHK